MMLPQEEVMLLVVLDYLFVCLSKQDCLQSNGRICMKLLPVKAKQTLLILPVT